MGFANNLIQKGCIGIHGGIDVKHRDKLISNFRSDNSIDILITTPGVARGLTLVEANYSIFFDRNFSLENYLQASKTGFIEFLKRKNVTSTR